MITFGFEPRNEVHPHALQNLGREGFAFEIRYKGDVIPLRVRVPGIQNIYNALAASAIALALKEPPERIAQGLSAFEGIAGRFTVSQLPNGCVLVDDTYNANPHSLKAAMGSLKALVPEGGRIIVGLGDMLELGPRAAALHRETGARVRDAELWVVGTHAADYAAGARRAGARVRLFDGKPAVAEALRGALGEGVVVLLKASRGAALEEVLEGLGSGPGGEG